MSTVFTVSSRTYPRISPSQLDNLSPSSGWKSILLLQFQTQFQGAIFGGIILSYIIVILNSSFAFSCPEDDIPQLYLTDSKRIIFAFDGFYFLDLMFMITFKNTNWEEVNHLYKSRNGIMIFVELLTVCPADAIYYYVINASELRMQIVYYLRLRYIIRLIRILYIIKRPKTIAKHDTIRGLALNFLLITGLSILTVTCLIHIHNCKRKCKYTDSDMYFSNFYVAAERITGKGFGELRQHIAIHDKLTFYGLSVISYIAYILLGYYTSRLVCSLITKDKLKFSFMNKYAYIKSQLMLWNRTGRSQHDYRSFIRSFNSYFEIICNRRKYSKQRMLYEQILPPIMFKEILLDLSWNAFKHSHLFRNEEMHFLRFLSTLVQQKFYTPGEILFKKHENKAGMIYVRNGIIQILSEEDGESPVISLSGGTCIGESTLILDYPSTCTVICKTYCEVTVLYRRDFIKSSKVYPTVFKKLLSAINMRYEESKNLSKVFEYQWQKEQIEERCTLIMVWIKRTLCTLLNIQYTSEQGEIEDSKLTTAAYHANFLDMLVITEKLELVTDTIFLKKEFPFIFQPDSIFIESWNILIAIVASILVIIYPWYLCNSFELPRATHLLIYIIVTVLWVIDLYFQMSTAIRTKDLFYVNLSTIIYYRLSTTSFVIDLISVVPFSLVILGMNGHVNPETLVLAEFHKLLKIYKFRIILRKLESMKSVNTVVLKYIKVCVSTIFLFYYTSALLFYMLCGSFGCPRIYFGIIEKYLNVKKNKFTIFVHFYTIASLFVADITTFPYLEMIEPKKYMVFIFIQVLYSFAAVYMLAGTAIVETLKGREVHEYKEFILRIEKVMKDLNVNFETLKRIKFYLTNRYYINKGILVLHPKLFYNNLSSNLFPLYMQFICGKFLNTVPIFHNLDESVMIEIAKYVHINNFSAGEVITYSEEVCKKIYFIELGYCSMSCLRGKILGPKDSFCAIEAFLNIPTFYTVTALTDCKIISLSQRKLSRLMTIYPDINNEFKIALRQTFKAEDIANIHSEILETHKYSWRREFVSFKNFSYRLHKLRAKDRDFCRAFRPYLYVFKYILLRHTFTSYGKFLLYWEIFRCIFAFLTNILTSVVYVCTDHCPLKHIFLVLDITAWVDLYVRQHVCYFNEMGIEVSHPMSTAKHYWKHGFLIDFLGAVPIDYLLKGDLIYLRINRILQLHRIFGFLWYTNYSNLGTSHMYDVVKFIPLTMLLINYASSLLVYSMCSQEEEYLNSTYICAIKYWVLKNMNSTTRENNHAAAVLQATAILSLIGFVKVRIKQFVDMFVVSVMVIIGHIFFIWVTARMVADNFYKKTDLTDYQEAMTKLLNFIAFRKIDKSIKKEVIEYFEYMWQRTKGTKLKQLLQPFNTAFKEDILFEIFGANLETSSIFVNASKSFFKSLLLEAKYEVYINKSIIYRVNDIHGFIFILLKGHIEVVGPDYNRLLMLSSGSVFGNLDNYPLTRQTLMMVAKGHVEVLKLSSIFFHLVLSKYSKLNAYFRILTAVNVDFIENVYTYEIELKTYTRNQAYSRTQLNCIYKTYFKMTRVIEENTFIQVWKFVILSIVCYLGSLLEIYQKASGETMMPVVLVLYLFDLLYLCRICLLFHTTYKNDFGTPVKMRRKIAEHYLKQKLGFYFDLAAVIPFEAISLIFMYQPYFWLIWTWCRINRIIRIVLVLDVLQSNKEKLHVNVTVTRMFYMLFWISIVIQTMACIIFYFRLQHKSFTNLPSLKKLELFGETHIIIIYAAAGAALTTIKLQFNIPVIICVIFITLICRFFITIFIAETCATLEAVNQNKTKYQQFAVYIKEYMKREHISPPLSKSVCQYINLLWIYHKGVQFPKLINEAPYYLREAILNAMFGFHIRRHPVLKNCHVDLIRQMAATMTIITLFPGNYIAYEGDIDGCMYFIHEGEVSVLSEDSIYSEVVEDVLSPGDVFGFEQGLYSQCGHFYTYKVTKCSIIVVLQRDKWIHLLKYFPASKILIQPGKDETYRKPQKTDLLADIV